VEKNDLGRDLLQLFLLVMGVTMTEVKYIGGIMLIMLMYMHQNQALRKEEIRGQKI
jgi:hypothetical protein